MPAERRRNVSIPVSRPLPADGARRRGRIIAAVIAVAMFGAGCGTAPSAPVGSAATSPPTPTQTAPPAVSQASTASPSAAPGTAAIAAFVTLVSTDTFAYQATIRGRSRHSASRLPVKGTLAASGRDYRVTADFTFVDGTFGVEHRYVNGKAWVRYEGDKWRPMTGFTAAASMSPFASVTGVQAVKYLGTKKVDGRTLYRIEIASVPIDPILIPAVNLTDETVTSGILELLIDDAGRPVSGTATTRGTGRVSRQLQEIIMELTLTFTKVGQKVTISAP